MQSEAQLREHPRPLLGVFFGKEFEGLAQQRHDLRIVHAVDDAQLGEAQGGGGEGHAVAEAARQLRRLEESRLRAVRVPGREQLVAERL